MFLTLPSFPQRIQCAVDLKRATPAFSIQWIKDNIIKAYKNQYYSVFPSPFVNQHQPRNHLSRAWWQELQQDIWKIMLMVVFYYLCFSYFHNYSIELKAMFNQLIHPSWRQKKFERPLYNDFLKQTQQLDSDHPPLFFRNQSSLRDKQQQIYDKLLSNSLQGGDLSQVIKLRLQSKRVEYPRDILNMLKSPSPTHNINTEDIEITLPENSDKRYNHDSIKRSKRRRIKTNVQDCPNSSQQQGQPYKQTIKQIDELNHIFFTNSKRKVRTNQQYESPQRNFYHISRQHDFQQYINHLDKQHSYNRQRERQTPVRQRVKGVSRREEVKPIRIELPVSPESRKKESFIKILKKVKARGESLLVKLSKFPSLKHMGK